LHEVSADWLALCGFLKVFPLFPEYRDRTVNIHPALLPRHGGRGMYGQHVHSAVLKAGDTASGATVHYVTEAYDEGATIAQVAVPVEPNDTPEALAARVFKAECQLYPQVINSLVAGALPLGHGQSKLYTLESLGL
jgi:folate-dependent phosphoribosylglycinamide formyltransferase PurN